jgi:hypothetical protein
MCGIAAGPTPKPGAPIDPSYVRQLLPKPAKRARIGKRAKPERGLRALTLIKEPSGYIPCMHGSCRDWSRRARRRSGLADPASRLQDERWRGGVGLGRAGFAALLSALVLGLTVPPPVTASSGILTHATETPDHMHGWLAGSVTWDQCSSSTECWWAAIAIVKPASEPCSVRDLDEYSELEKGEATSPIYRVWSDTGRTENRTEEVGGIGFPAVIGQQACLEVEYKTSGGPGCGNGCFAAEKPGVVLASLPFGFEQRPVSPTPSAPATSAPPAGSPTPSPAVGQTPTRAQRLRKTLRHCRRKFHRRRPRKICERHAREKYGPLPHTPAR